MTNTNLFGILATVFLIIGFFSLAGSLANPAPWATPTPTPAAEPTITPNPTPKPEPTAKPTLEMHCRSTADIDDLKVDVTGALTYNKTAIINAPVYIGFSADSGNTWENFTLVQTDSDGGFAAAWTPNATGSYLMCAHWGGNDSLHWVNATANLALTPDSAGNEFSIVSNSTISNLAYNSTTKELSFSTNGTSGTTGYLYASIPKTLLGDIQAIAVNIDGQPIACGSESHEDVWVICCVYGQSEHVFTMQLPFVVMLNSQETPWIPIAAIVIAVLIAIIAAIMTIRRRRRTAATVASILKENRPTY
jgi:hypothetical protein